jgi:hypothetical protein
LVSSSACSQRVAGQRLDAGEADHLPGLAANPGAEQLRPPPALPDGFAGAGHGIVGGYGRGGLLAGDFGQGLDHRRGDGFHRERAGDADL